MEATEQLPCNTARYYHILGNITQIIALRHKECKDGGPITCTLKSGPFQGYTDPRG